VLCGWELPDGGTIRFRGTPLTSAAALPWRDVAVVPQDLAMIEELSVGENVTLPLRLSGADSASYRKAERLLSELGLAELAPRAPAEASLGEQQRAALARAVVGGPALLLADEPTGHQDEGWTKGVMRAIRAGARDGMACLVATHNDEAMAYLDRVFVMRDGELVEAASPR
jgi:putative ABC transport system ATP-binding protein